MSDQHASLVNVLEESFAAFERAAAAKRTTLRPQEIGRVTFVSHGIARLSGLSGVGSEELVRFPNDEYGVAFNLDPDEVGVVLLGQGRHIKAGDEVRRTHRVLDTPVGDALLGRAIDVVGRPVDELGPIHASRRLPTERPAPAIMHRAPVTSPLQTGLKVVDALIPVGRGQRQLILGDRQTGKTAIAVDTIINQRHSNVLCIYCAVGKRSTSVARVIGELREHQALPYTVIVTTTEDDPPGIQYVAPYAAMSMAEHFMQHGRDVLVVFDDLTRHARAYRELSLLLRRPPGREAFPGDIFYIHSRLLERSTHLREEFGGGSITAMPIVETESQNLSAYIPTNLISITDGQIYLSPDLFDKGVMPAVDVGKSVSRVGGKTQLKSFRDVSGDLRLAYAQFEELETFARFGTRLDAATRQLLDRGQRVREVLKQPQYETLSVAEQVSVLATVNRGVFDSVAIDRMGDAERAVRAAVIDDLGDLARRMDEGDSITEDDYSTTAAVAQTAVAGFVGDSDGNA